LVSRNKTLTHLLYIIYTDFDVHHGNGTEVCVENLIPSSKKAKFDLPMGGEMKLFMPQWKPWLGEHDAENVLFCSVHGFGKALPGLDPDPHQPPFLPSFYPGSGEDKGWKDSNILDVGQNSTSRFEWRQSWRSVVLPRLRNFKPDMIFISAGFDAHAKDSINGGFCGALEQDYEWLTQALVAIANEQCQGRIVSVLEGGYRIQGMCVSAFARSVLEHVKVLAEADPNFFPDQMELDWEITDFEKQIKAAKEVEAELKAAKQNHVNAAALDVIMGGGEDEDEDEDGEEDETSHNHHLHEEEEEEEEDEEKEISKNPTTTTTTATTEERPKRRTTKDINFVQLNEDMNREKDAKRQKVTGTE